MQNVARVLAACVLLIGLCGCVESEETIVIKADGTCTFEGRYVVDVTKARTVFDAVRKKYTLLARSMKVTDKLPRPFHRSWFEKTSKKQKGATILAGTSTEKDGLETSTILAEFDSLRTAARAGFFLASTANLKPEDLPRAKPPAATTPKKAAAPARRGLRFKLEESWIQTMGTMTPAQALPQFGKHISGAQIVRHITVPGRIVSTNGKISEDGRTVTFTHTFKTLSKSKSVVMQLVFEPDEGSNVVRFSPVEPNQGDLLARFSRPPPTPAKKGGANDTNEKQARPLDSKEPPPGRVPGDRSKR